MAQNQNIPTLNLNNTDYNIFLPRTANEKRKLNWRTIKRVIRYLNNNGAPAPLAEIQARQRYIRNNLLRPYNLAIRGNKIFDLDKPKAQTAFRNIRMKENTDKRFTKKRNREQRKLEKRQTEIIKEMVKARKNRQTATRQIGGRIMRKIDNSVVSTYRFRIQGNDIFSQIKDATALTYPRHRNQKVQIIISPHDPNAPMDLHLGEGSLKTTYRNNIGSALRAIRRKYQDKNEEYEDEDGIYDWEMKTIIIRYILRDLLQGQGGTRTKAMADKTSISIDKEARYRCCWHCIYILNYF